MYPKDEVSQGVSLQVGGKVRYYGTGRLSRKLSPVVEVLSFDASTVTVRHDSGNILTIERSRLKL